MKNAKLFILENCPYCKEARRILNDLLQEEKYAKFNECVNFQLIDEAKDTKLAESYDYYYVPTFYLDEVKLIEGATDTEQIRAFLDKAVA